MNSMLVNWNLLVSAVKLVSFERVTCSFMDVTCSFDAIPFALWFQNDEYCNTYTVAEIQLKRCGGGGAKLCEFPTKFVLILHIFLITMEKYENYKNDFLQTRRIRQLDKYSISIK